MLNLGIFVRLGPIGSNQMFDTTIVPSEENMFLTVLNRAVDDGHLPKLENGKRKNSLYIKTMYDIIRSQLSTLQISLRGKLLHFRFYKLLLI